MTIDINIKKIGAEVLYIKSDYIYYLQINYISEIITQMFLCMNNNNGIGLASSQIGFLKRMFIYLNVNKLHIVLNEICINPVFFYKSFDSYVDYEGCLSVFNFNGLVKRFIKIGVYYHNFNFKLIKNYLFKINSRIVQHEIDHLNGILFISRLCNIRVIKYII